MRKLLKEIKKIVNHAYILCQPCLILQIQLKTSLQHIVKEQIDII